MEIQLEELISKIKKDGLEEANKEALNIVESAKNKANTIISEANYKVKSLLGDVKKEEQLSLKRSEEAISNASRDLILNVNAQIKTIFHNILQEAVEKSLKEDTLLSLIKNSIESCKVEDELVIELSESDANNLADAIVSKFASKVSGGIEIKPTKTISSGFKIYGKSDSLSYDFTSETIASHLGEYTNSKLSEIIKKAGKSSPC